MSEGETREVPEGYRLEWQPDNDWRIGGRGRLCSLKSCVRPAVAALKRNWKFGFRWYHYCADHLYGRKIEDGVVYFERLVELEEVPSGK